MNKESGKVPGGRQSPSGVCKGAYSENYIQANGHGTPLEDHLLVDEKGGIFILVDGVSRTNYGASYPDPSPAEIAAKRFVESAYQNLIITQELDCLVQDRILEALTAGNNAISHLNKELFSGSVDYLANDLAGVVGLIALLADRKLVAGYVGDVGIYRISEQAVELLTDSQTKKVSELRRRPGGLSDETTRQIRREIRNNPKHEMGFGVFTGEDAAFHFVQFQELLVIENEHILLASDGIAELVRGGPGTLRNCDLASIASQAQEYQRANAMKIDDVGLISLDCSAYLQWRKT